MGGTYVVSDLHGQIELYKAICNSLSADDKVICLGDCGDRGPAGWETIKAVYENPNWTYLMGNHEHLLIYAMHEALVFMGKQQEDSDFAEYTEDAIPLLYYNGGKETFHSWMKEGADPTWFSCLSSLPYFTSVVTEDGTTVLLSHAGFTPYRDITQIKNFNLVWDRKHINDKYSNDWQDVIILHGHTPCKYINKKWQPEDGAIYYANDRKICIDMASFATNTTCLFDINTFDEHIIQLSK